MIKRKRILTALLTGLLLGGCAEQSWAQRRINTQFVPYSKVGFGVGTSTYYGELAGYRAFLKSTFTLPRWNVGLSYARQFTPKLAVRASFTYARITGDDYKFTKNKVDRYPAQYVRNLHFRNDLKEFALVGQYQFVPEGRNSNNRPKLTPYVFGGLALLAHSPEARDSTSTTDGSRGPWVKLQPLGTEGQGQPGYAKPYSLVTLAIPFGFGVRYRLNDNFDVAAELGYRYTFTHYLDDVYGAYPGANVLQSSAAQRLSNRSGELIAARKGGDRTAALTELAANGFTGADAPRGGFSKFNDSYLLTSFQIHYIIPAKIKCPPIR